MHTLHTTQAFVLGTYPHGESNRVYKLLTKNLGLLYAHAQSVRELKSRNRFALQVGAMPTVTLVKGREVWRITSAQHDSEVCKGKVRPYVERMLRIVGKLVPVEDIAEEIFSILEHVVQACNTHTDATSLIEAVAMLRIMDKLGYIAHPLEDVSVAEFLKGSDFSQELLEKAKEHRHKLISRVNTALEEAQ